MKNLSVLLALVFCFVACSGGEDTTAQVVEKLEPDAAIHARAVSISASELAEAEEASSTAPTAKDENRSVSHPDETLVGYCLCTPKCPLWHAMEGTFHNGKLLWCGCP